MRGDYEGARIRHGLSRRQLLGIGSLGSLGLCLPRLLRAEAHTNAAVRASSAGRMPRPIRSCILIFHYGGPSHIDTFDMKPNAPAEIRGQFGSIATSVPGLRVCEHLPHTARVMDRIAVIRSMHHPMTNHNAAAFTTLSGRNPLKGDLELLGNDRNDPPCYGAILSATLREKQGFPTFVALPHVMYNVVQLPGQVAGFLGSAHNPFQVSADPSLPDFHLGELDLPGDLSLDRLDQRASLLNGLDEQHRCTTGDGHTPSAIATTVKETAPAPLLIPLTFTPKRRSASYIRHLSVAHFTLGLKTRNCATVMVSTNWGKAFSWLADSLRLASDLSRFTMASTMDRTLTGTHIPTSSAGLKPT